MSIAIPWRLKLPEHEPRIESLLKAVRSENHNEIRRLHQRKPTLISSQETNYGLTPVHEAAQNGFADTLRLLLGLGGSPTALSDVGDTPLHSACSNGDISTIQVLVGYKNVDINSANLYGDTPLFMAAENGHVNAVWLLSDLGADMNLRDIHGFHPIYIAAFRGHVEIVRLLVTELGCNPEVMTNNGDTAVLIAARECHHNVVQVLVDELGAHPDVPNKAGITPFVAAAYAGDVTTCCTLLKHGASASSRHLPNLSSLKSLGHYSVIQLIDELRSMQDLACSGQVQPIKRAVIETECLPPPVKWVNMLPHSTRQELLTWVQDTLQDSAGCYMALFGPVRSHDKKGFRSVVGHDGFPNITNLIVSFVVHKKAKVREKIRILSYSLPYTYTKWFPYN